MDKTQFKLLLKYLKYLHPYRKKLLITLFLGGSSVLLGLVNPYLSKLVVDRAIINKDLKTFVILGLIGSSIFILNGLISALMSFLRKGINLKVGFDLNKKVFTQLQQFPLAFFKEKATGEHMFRISYDIERVVDCIVSVPDDLINIFPRVFFILAIILYLDWQMALFSLILAPILYLPIYFLTQRMRKILERLLNNCQNIYKYLEEVFSHIYLVKAFGKEKTQTRDYLKILMENIRIRLKNVRLEIFSTFAGGGFERVIIGLITLFGGYQVIKGKISIGTLTAIMIYLTQLVGLQNTFIFFLQKMTLGLVSCKRLDEIMEEKPMSENDQEKNKIILDIPCIQFKKVSFGYKSDEYILKDLEFEINKGWISLVGPSGCGKTTILNLLLGLYIPWGGTIFIDGFNLKELNSRNLKEQVGIALQEPFLWNDTIENNIIYAKPEAMQKEIEEVAKITGVDEFAVDLTDGYKTIIGENAAKLSEGQKQKIAIARALIKRPKILILDEAMSSMDSISEEKIIQSLKKLPIPIVITVSHRLSTITASDLVYFLKKPDELIIDKPQVLLEKDREFFNLFAAQIKETFAKDNMMFPVTQDPE